MEEILDINTLFGPLPEASTDLTADVLLERMQKHGIGRACTLSTLGFVLDPAVGNAATRAACSENAALIPVATLSPQMYFGDASAVLRLKQEGFRLVRFFPIAQGWPVDFAPFHVLLRTLDEIGLPIMVEVNAPGQITALMTAFSAFPSPVILSGVTTELLSEAIVACRQNASWCLEISRMLAPGAMQAVAGTVGAERLLFGTGSPARPVASVLNTLRYSGLTDAERQSVLAANALRILNL